VTSRLIIGGWLVIFNSARYFMNILTKLKHWLGAHYQNFIIFFLIFVLGFVFFFPAIVVFIPAGHGGILWKRFAGGTQLIPALSEGVNVIWPWDKIEIYDLRLCEDTQTYSSIIANDGLAVDMELTLRYRLRPEYLGTLHKLVGPQYNEVFIMPQVGSILRGIVSLYKADELYAFRRQRIQEEIYNAIKNELMYKGIIGAPLSTIEKKGFILVQDVLIRNVTLPNSLLQSIEQKIQQDQLAQEYIFRIKREVFEAQRKQIEASGIQAFQEVVNTGLTDHFLRWRGIEATLDLAQATTPKVVFIGSGNQGLPLVFNGGAPVNQLGSKAEKPEKPVIADVEATDTAPAAIAKIAFLPPEQALLSKKSDVESAELKQSSELNQIMPTNVIHEQTNTSEKENTTLKLSADDWRVVQRGLNKLGMNAGAVDGLPGRLTRAAISAWQRSHQRLVSGHLTQEDYVLLLNDFQ
jgi:regulator of protease activity HflC (stomatin/prohibitin superfamily)